jgi:protein-S-isoprenylcysteine O-methyltransferase Ste14
MKIAKFILARKVMIANILVSIQFFTLAVLTILAFSNISNSTHEYLIIESILMVAGVLVIFLAGMSLAPALRVSPIPKVNAPFIEVGIYRYVRHPMYLGVILIGFSLASSANSISAWILELILIVNLNFKARLEDALLREIHHDAWHYQRHTSRILPCVGSSCRNNCDIDGMAKPTN